MTADAIAIATLSGYALVAVLAVAWQIWRADVAWQTWALYVVERLYVPLMFHWRANRRCPFPTNAPALVVANHRSPVDPLMIWMNHHLTDDGRRPIRLIHFLMAKEYEQVGGVAWIARHMQIIPVERSGRDLASAKKALQKLKDGDWVGIFPEGRINTGTNLLPAEEGIAWLALRAEVPVYPVFLHETPQGNSMVEPFCTRSRVRVTFGDPIDLSAYYGRRKSQAVLLEVTNLMMTRVAELGGVEYHPPEVLPFDAPRTATG